MRAVKDLFELHRQTRDTLDLIQVKLRLLEDRVIYLEANQNQVISEARSAAATASTVMASSLFGDTVTRVTRLEMRLDLLKPSVDRPQIPLD